MTEKDCQKKDVAHTSQRKSRRRIAINVVLILAFMISLLDLQLVTPVYAEGEYNWVAYNDCAGTTSGNNTNYTVTSGSTTGYLKDYDTGTNLTASVTFSSSETLTVRTTSGAFPNSGTDAYTTFNGYASMVGVISYGASGYYVDVTFEGLDPAKTYTFAASANRNSSSYTDRISKFTISGVDTATNASTSGVTVISNESVAFSTGYNTVSGYVARWTGIQPGTDGTFVVRVDEQSAGNEGYGPSVFMLAEEESTDPTITTSGILSEFTSEAGEYSDNQTYTVSGVNLEGDITITPPVDFELSLNGLDGWVSNPGSLTLSPDGGGAVISTEIFVRFYLAGEGTSSGSITHTSANASQKDVTVSGTASIPLSGWVAYNDLAWVSGQETINITLYTISGDTTGLLVDYNTGEEIPVTAAITPSGSPSVVTGTYGGSETDEGTDAYEVFHGIANMAGVVQYGSTTGWYVDVTFTGLDPDSTYAFVTSANRDGDYTDRNTKFTLLDVSTATNTSSDGVTISTTTFTGDTTVFNTGENTANGFVASWEEIVPGEDGDFTVRAESNSSSSRQAYAFSVFKLAEEAPAGPTITTSVESLPAFSMTPGGISDAQTYTVSGVNLTEDISIAAPAGFLLSLDNYEYNVSLTLPQTDGTVAATTVFVALFSEMEGSFAGDIVHSSAGAISKAVAVSGEVSNTFTTSFQEGVNGYEGTEDTYLMEANPSTAYGDATWVEWDGDDPYGTGTANYGLLKFDNIIGTGSGQILPGATILSATLTYTVSNTGDDGTLNEVVVDWSESTTYNTLGSTAGVQAEDYGDGIGAASGSSTGTHTVDVTSSVQGWLNGEANLGWIFRPTNDDGVEFYSSEYTTVSDRPLLEVSYYAGEINNPPNTPILVQPSDDASDVAIPPTLEVTVSDPESDLMDVSFYGRPVGGASGEDFLFIAVPDTQMLAQSYPTTMYNQFQWVANQDVVFVTSLGDIVNTASSSTQWDNADAAYDLLDTAGIPYSVGPGNHDLNALYTTYFGSSRFSGKPWYQGYYTSGTDNYNNYSFFSASGLDFIVINLQYNSTVEHWNWADALLKANTDRQGIVVQHNILNIDNSWQAQGVFTALKDNPNLFLMLCGHMHSASDGSAYRAEAGDDDHTIHILLTDYQDYGDNDNLRLLTFKPADDEIFAQIYSPKGDSYLTSVSNYEEFSMSYEMSGSEPFELIGTVNDVSDGNVSLSWPGLAYDTEYEWYVEVSDGTSSTTGATWSFTTLEENNPPVVSDIPDQTVAEGGSFATINLDDYVSDVDNSDDQIAWTYSGNSGLSVTIVNRVATIGIPDENWNGSETITFTATDPGLVTDSDAATFTVTAVNDPPVVSDIPGETIAEGESFATINLDDYVSDVDNSDDQITWTYSGNIELTVSIVNQVATIGIPSVDWNGTETITFTATDPGLATDSDAATFTVTAVNNPPVVSDIPDQTISEGGSFATINLDDYVSDVDNSDDQIIWTYSGNIELTVSIVNQVATIGIPSVDWNGTETITFTATDPGLATDSDEATFTVTAVNDAPVVSDIPDQTVAEGGSFATINLDDYVSDVDNSDDQIAWTYSGNSGLSITIVNRVATIGIPDGNWNGSETITFTATDPGLATDSDAATFTVTAVNDAPVLNPIGDKELDEKTLLSFTATATDPDQPAQDLTFYIANGADGSVPDGAVMETSGGFSWIPTEDQGPGVYTFDVCVSDGALNDCETITVTVYEVNEAPVLAAIGDKEVEELSELAFTATASDADLPPQTLTFTLEDGDAGEVPTGASITAGGAFSWTPTEEQAPGEYTFDVCVSDGEDTACETITVTVSEFVPKACYVLTIGHTGDGSNPVPDLANSEGCGSGTYEPGEVINLSGAIPTVGWHIASWYGTEADVSTSNTNVVIMPEGDTEVGVNYETSQYIPLFLGPNN